LLAASDQAQARQDNPPANIPYSSNIYCLQPAIKPRHDKTTHHQIFLTRQIYIACSQ
jgi:hypothetical protein